MSLTHIDGQDDDVDHDESDSDEEGMKDEASGNYHKRRNILRDRLTK